MFRGEAEIVIRFLNSLFTKKGGKNMAVQVNQPEIEQVIQRIKDNHIAIVDLKFTDLPGLWQHFSIPVQELYEPNEPIKSIWSGGWF